MIKKANNDAPLCKWTEHKWKVTEYVVVNDEDVFQVKYCPKCGHSWSMQVPSTTKSLH